MSKGIFIPDITVDMFRNASLEAVEELLVSGEMRDIDAPTIDIVRCKECKYDGTWKCKWRNVMARSFPSADDFCSYGERSDT